jgi:hypothetical protein
MDVFEKKPIEKVKVAHLRQNSFVLSLVIFQKRCVESKTVPASKVLNLIIAMTDCTIVQRSPRY